MKRKTHIALLLSAAALSVGVVAYAGTNVGSNIIKAGPGEANVLSLTQRHAIGTEGFVVRSAEGNDFHIDATGITKDNGEFIIGTNASLGNREAINGISKIEFTNCVGYFDFQMRLAKQDSYTLSSSYYISEPNESYSVYLSNKTPAYFKFTTDDTKTFHFKEMKIYYYCFEEEHTINIASMYSKKCMGYSGYSASNYLCFSANVPFADLDLTGAYLSSDAYREIIKNKDNVSNLNISYAENPDSTVILPGRHIANITWTLWFVMYGS